MPAARGIEVIPSGAPLGAEIVGVDLAEEMDVQMFRAIEAAYHEHIGIVFRNQQLMPAQHLRLARRFDTLEISPRMPFALPGDPEILRRSNILDADGQPIGNADGGRTWHTDLSYTATPLRGSLLYALEVPTDERGEALGDTLFVSTPAGYDALPEKMKQPLHGLRAMHRTGAKPYVPGSQLADAVKDLPDAIHPVIRTHPVTGRRAIYVRAGECVVIIGMPDAEALPLIQALSDFATRPEFLSRHHRRVGDLLMWDHGCAQHLAVNDNDDDLPQRRLMHRVTVNGSVPV